MRFKTDVIVSFVTGVIGIIIGGVGITLAIIYANKSCPKCEPCATTQCSSKMFALVTGLKNVSFDPSLLDTESELYKNTSNFYSEQIENHLERGLNEISSKRFIIEGPSSNHVQMSISSFRQGPDNSVIAVGAGTVSAARRADELPADSLIQKQILNDPSVTDPKVSNNVLSLDCPQQPTPAPPVDFTTTDGPVSTDVFDFTTEVEWSDSTLLPTTARVVTTTSTASSTLIPTTQGVVTSQSSTRTSTSPDLSTSSSPKSTSEVTTFSSSTTTNSGISSTVTSSGSETSSVVTTTPLHPTVTSTLNPDSRTTVGTSTTPEDVTSPRTSSVPSVTTSTASTVSSSTPMSNPETTLVPSVTTPSTPSTPSVTTSTVSSGSSTTSTAKPESSTEPTVTMTLKPSSAPSVTPSTAISGSSTTRKSSTEATTGVPTTTSSPTEEQSTFGTTTKGTSAPTSAPSTVSPTTTSTTMSTPTTTTKPTVVTTSESTTTSYLESDSTLNPKVTTKSSACDTKCNGRYVYNGSLAIVYELSEDDYTEKITNFIKNTFFDNDYYSIGDDKTKISLLPYGSTTTYDIRPYGQITDKRTLSAMVDSYTSSQAFSRQPRISDALHVLATDEDFDAVGSRTIVIIGHSNASISQADSLAGFLKMGGYRIIGIAFGDMADFSSLTTSGISRTVGDNNEKDVAVDVAKRIGL